MYGLYGGMLGIRGIEYLEGVGVGVGVGVGALQVSRVKLGS